MSTTRTYWFFFTITVHLLSDASGSCQLKRNSEEILSHCIKNIQGLESFMAARNPVNAMKLYLENIANIESTIDELKYITEIRPIELFVILNSNLTTFSDKLVSLKSLRFLGLGGNNLKTIDLNVLPYAKSLINLDVSRNEITEFTEEYTSYNSTQYLEIINLSYNKIEIVPLNCFYSTRESLKYIDLSHNNIRRIDNHAFSYLISLQTLKLSNNRLINLGMFLYPVINIVNLYLNHNQIKDINGDVFQKSSVLSHLDLSFNIIKTLDDHALSSLTNLKHLNINNNRIQNIKEITLRNNIHLEALFLCNNFVSYLEQGTFSVMQSLKTIGLEAALAMDLRSHVFTGLKITELNLAGSILNKIDDTPFLTLANNLTSLNLSSCKIQKISKVAFDSFISIKKLDLSRNNLTDLDYLTDDGKGRLAKLTELYLQHNAITEIKLDTFQHMVFLTDLDFSYNKINTLVPMAFKNHKHLVNIRFINNKLNNSLLSNTFFGLDNVKHLEVMNTTYKRWDSYALTGLKNVIFINASHGELDHIDYNAFTGTTSIQVLDLSYNKIQIFNVTISANKNMKNIYLNNNELASILKYTFDGFDSLKILNLCDNKLKTIDNSVFKSLFALKQLDVSKNTGIKIDENVLDDLSLDIFRSSYINDHITFTFQNITIYNLEITFSRITNLGYLNITNIKELYSVDLSNNFISVIDKYSFGMGTDTLKLLNLSCNSITYVQPGAFLKTNKIINLDLSYNNIHIIQFGALRGLHNLATLNISNNKITKLYLSLLYDIQSVSTIISDSNRIKSIALSKKLFNLKTLSVGENLISCDEIVQMKFVYNINVTAKYFLPYSENVDGIACFSNSTNMDENYNTERSTSFTYFDSKKISRSSKVVSVKRITQRF